MSTGVDLAAMKGANASKGSNPLRDAEKTKANIVRSAQISFSQHGYDGAGVREIALHAGVDKVLINRYFGTKAKLFEQAITVEFDISSWLGGSRDSFGARIAAHLSSKPNAKFDPLVAMLRSLGSEEAVHILRRGLREQFIEPLARWLGPPDGHEKALLIASQICGFAIMRRVLDLQNNETECSEFKQRPEQALAHILDEIVGTAQKTSEGR